MACPTLRDRCDPCELTDRMAFIAEYFDAQASLIKRYLLKFYLADHSLELYDLKANKRFMKRTAIEGIRAKDLFVGSMLNILAKQYTVVDYADEYTRRIMAPKSQRTFAMIKPDAMKSMGCIITHIYKAGFRISRARMVQIPECSAREFYKEHKDKAFYNTLVKYVTSSPALAMELVGENAVYNWRQVIGPTDSNKARETAPESVRARYGTDGTYNAAHGSDSMDSAARELELFFPPTRSGKEAFPLPPLVTFKNSTCCVVKPHIIKNGLLGEVVNLIVDNGFNITAFQAFYMGNADAAEFYEVYKGVVAEYPDMVNHLLEGPCFAMEISSEDKDTPIRFREFVGPADPELARRLRPGTLRARFGKDKIHNAVHCTDLPEDGLLEVEYFFKILQ